MILPNIGFIVTGTRSEDYVLELTPEVLDRPFLDLPNLVDDAVWARKVAEARLSRSQLRQKLGIDPHIQLWVCPARLVEDKGLHPFLSALEGLSGMTLLIAGDGPLRSALQRLVAEKGIPATFLGHQAQDEVVALYAAADLFVLPSLRDASPLSAVEACAASLPLLVSKRIGNLPDVLIEGRNGWTLDPLSPTQMRSACLEVLKRPLEEFRAMGSVSRELFDANFQSVPRIKKLAEFFLRVHRLHSGTE